MNLKQFDPHTSYIKNLLRKKCKSHDDADDVYQEIMIYLWNRPNQEIIYPKTYISNLINWYILKAKKDHKSREIKDGDKKGESIIPIFNSETGWNSYELDDKIIARLKSIPKVLFESLSMQIFDGLSIKQIANNLSTNENTIKTRIKRAKEYLRS